MPRAKKTKNIKILPLLFGMLFVSLLFIFPGSVLAACTKDADCVENPTVQIGKCTLATGLCVYTPIPSQVAGAATPGTPAEVPTGTKLMNYIIIIVIMVAGIKVSMSVTSEAGSLVDKGISGATGGRVKGMKEGAKGLYGGAKAGAKFATDKLIGADLKDATGLKKVLRAGQVAAGIGRTARNLPSMVSDKLKRDRDAAAADAAKALSKGSMTGGLTGDVKKEQEKIEGYNLDRIQRMAENEKDATTGKPKFSDSEQKAALKTLKDIADGKGKNRSDADKRNAEKMKTEIEGMTGSTDISKLNSSKELEALRDEASLKQTSTIAGNASGLAETEELDKLILDAQDTTKTAVERASSLKAIQNIAKDPLSAHKTLDDQKAAISALKDNFAVTETDPTTGVTKTIPLNKATPLNARMNISAKPVARAQFQGTPAELVKDFVAPTGGGSFTSNEVNEVLSKVSDDDIERISTDVASSTDPDAATAQANIAAVKNQRIDNLAASHEEAIREIHDSPLYAGTTPDKVAARNNLLVTESKRADRMENIINTGNIEQARQAMKTAYGQDFSGASEAHIRNTIEARRRALTNITAP